MTDDNTVEASQGTTVSRKNAASFFAASSLFNKFCFLPLASIKQKAS